MPRSAPADSPCVAPAVAVCPRRGAARTGRTGVFDSRKAPPGRRNDQSSPPASTKNPRSRYCGHSMTVAPSLTGVAGMRSAWLSSTISSNCPLRKPRLGLFVEFGALRTAEHDRDLVLAILRQSEHRADVEPMLPRQTVDAEPAVGSTHNAHHRTGLRIGRHAESSHLFGQQHRVRKCRQQRLHHRNVDFDDATCVGGHRSQGGECAQRGVTTGDVLGDPRAGLYRGPIRVAHVDPPGCRLHGQRRGDAVTQRSALAEVRDPNDDKSGP